MESVPRLISIVIPVFNEAEVLPLLRKRLETLRSSLPYPAEWVMVDDGSRDGTPGYLSKWADSDHQVKVVSLTRNFGHQAAITCGLDVAAGDVVVVMDADLQDPPELIPKMVEEYRKGFDIVYARRAERHGESTFKRLSAFLFYKFMRRFVHSELPQNTGEFRLMSRSSVEALARMREGYRFIRGMTAWLGFSQTEIVFDRPPRAAGNTKFPTIKMLRFAWDAILSFTTLPIRIATYIGIVVILLGVGVAIHALRLRLMSGQAVPGWASLVILNTTMGGMILLFLGLLGEYIGRIYEELKHRPLYIVHTTRNIASVVERPRAYCEPSKLKSSPRPKVRSA